MPQNSISLSNKHKLLIDKEKTYTQPFLTNTQSAHGNKEQATQHELFQEDSDRETWRGSLTSKTKL